MDTIIKNIICIGTGNMGPATALRYAVAGHNVTLTGRSRESLDKGLADAAQKLQELAAAGDIDKSAAQKIIAKLRENALVVRFDEEFSPEFLAVAANADIALESAEEVAKTKQQIFARLDKICPKHTRFLTNSSAIPPSVLISGTTDDVMNEDGSITYGTRISEARQTHVGCAHHWGPAHIQDGAEVLVGIFPAGSKQQKIAQETLAITEDLLRSAGVTPVRMNKEIVGFIGNRMQIALQRTAYALLHHSIATAEEIDAALTNSFGQYSAEVGPLKDATLRGADAFSTPASILAIQYLDLHNAHNNHVDGIPTPLHNLVQTGNLGIKTGQGIYAWPAHIKDKFLTARTQAIFRARKNDTARTQQIKLSSTYPQSPQANDVIAETLRLAVLREALHLLNEGYASATDIDFMVTKTMGRRWGASVDIDEQTIHAGVFRNSDAGGKDVFYSIFKSTGHTLCNNNDIAAMYRHAEINGLLPTSSITATRPSSTPHQASTNTAPAAGGGAGQSGAS